jgi:hypothetical protein
MLEIFEQFAERWERDRHFRHYMHAALTILTIALVILLISSGYLAAQHIAPWLFTDAASSSSATAASNNAHSSVGFPILPVAPHDRLEPTTYPVPYTHAMKPTPRAPTPTPTPTFPVAPPGCPSLAGTPAYSSNSPIQDATLPNPMHAGCPAMIHINAPTHPNGKITISLTFGVLSQLACSINNSSGQTDAQGKAAIVIIVPPSSCFHGTTITSGLITVDGDASANANLAAVD